MINICCAHFVNSITCRLAKLVKNKKIQIFLVSVVVRMVQSSTLQRVSAIFAISVLLLCVTP